MVDNGRHFNKDANMLAIGLLILGFLGMAQLLVFLTYGLPDWLW